MTLRRLGNGPLITRGDIADLPPDLGDVSSVFNPGAVMIGGKTVLLLRVQSRGRRTFTIPAVSSDGIKFTVSPQPVFFDWDGKQPSEEIFHIYDARITQIAGELYVVTAVDMGPGCRLAIWQAVGAVQDSFLGLDKLRFLGWSGFDDSRNGVIFPEQVGGRYLMLQRPNLTKVAGAPPTGSSIVLSTSNDLLHWEEAGTVMSGNFHYWDELIGSGPPPVKTRGGWLHIYHGIATHFQASNIYQAGAVLLDLNDPTRVLARTRDNILEPRESWELTGQVPNVVFPGGMTVSDFDHDGFAKDNATVRVYYGAADTAIGLAETTVDKLIAELTPACGER